MVFFIFLSNLHAVAEGEADAAVGVDRHMIQQFSPGFRIESRHLLRQAVMGAVKFFWVECQLIKAGVKKLPEQ